MFFPVALVIITITIIFSTILNTKDTLEVEEIIVYISVAEPRAYFVVHITPDRKLIHQEFFSGDIDPDDPERNLIKSTEKILSEEEYNQFVDAISKNSFMTLPEKINAKNITDGESIKMEVKANGTSHSVGGYMPQYANKRFNRIYEQFRNLID